MSHKRSCHSNHSMERSKPCKEPAKNSCRSSNLQWGGVWSHLYCTYLPCVSDGKQKVTRNHAGGQTLLARIRRGSDTTTPNWVRDAFYGIVADDVNAFIVIKVKMSKDIHKLSLEFSQYLAIYLYLSRSAHPSCQLPYQFGECCCDHEGKGGTSKSIGQHAHSSCIKFICARAQHAVCYTARMWLRVIIDSLTLLTCRKAFLEGRCTKRNYGSTYRNIRYNSINTQTITSTSFHLYLKLPFGCWAYLQGGRYKSLARQSIPGALPRRRKKRNCPMAKSEALTASRPSAPAMPTPTWAFCILGGSASPP